MAERRTTARQRTFKRGVISHQLGVGIDCVIRNLSDKGALLELASPRGVPNEFVLVIKPEDTRRHGEVVWRMGRKIGCRFV